MPFMVMANGQEMHLYRPDFTGLPVEVIAHHLATITRFTGAASRPYSVAEHSLLVVEIMERELRASQHTTLMGGLMHDAEESVTNDLSSPAKQVVGQPWRDFASTVKGAMAREFGLVETFKCAYATGLIHQADLIALATERAQLMPSHHPDGLPLQGWPILEGFQPVTWVDLMDSGRVSSTWQDWRDRFVDKFHEVDFGRKEMAGGAA